MVTDDVLITRKVIIDLEAVLLSLFSLFNSLIAFSPKGVAAFPSPNIFITIFEDIYPMALSPSGISGKSTFTIFDNFFDIISNNPDDSAIFIVPSHKHIKGKIPKTYAPMSLTIKDMLINDVIVPLYFQKNKLKVELGLCQGKKLYDKRQTIKERDIKRHEYLEY